MKNLQSACALILGLLIVAGAGSLTGCATARALLNDPTIIQDAVGAIVAIAEDTGTPAASINQEATKALTTATKINLTVSQLELVMAQIPGIGKAVSTWVADNPDLAQTQASLVVWLKQVVADTTPGTTAAARVAVRVQMRRSARGVRGKSTDASAGSSSG